MRKPCLIYPVFLLALASGCQSLHSYRPVAVLARDAETKKPIPGAEVHLSYPMAHLSLAPYESAGTTGGDGVVHLRAAPYGDLGVRLEANASGYLYEEKYLENADVQAIEPAHWFEDVDRRPPAFVVEMYANPHPTVELVVLKEFRGWIKAHFHIDPAAPCPPGKRCFTFAVPESGVVEMVGPPLLQRVNAPDFRARLTDGTPLRNDVTDYQVGFWWLKCEGDQHYLLVGTRGQFDEFRSTNEKIGDAESEPVRGGGKGGGRGRHNRGGNQSPADSDSAGTGP